MLASPFAECLQHLSFAQNAQPVGLLFWGVLLPKLDGEALLAETERLQDLWLQLKQNDDSVIERCWLGQYGKLSDAPNFYLALKDCYYAVDCATTVFFPQLPDDGLHWLQAACERLALPVAEPRWHLTVMQAQ